MIFRTLESKFLGPVLGSIFLFLSSFSSQAELNVVTTTTDLNWVVHQIGGERVSSQSLLSASADPHYVDAMPHFVYKVAKADLVCFVGLDLEIGWLPKVLFRSGNRQVQAGGKGYCEAGKAVKPLDKINGKVDRSMGDVHPAGNPHYHLGPKYLSQAAELIFEKLVGLDPGGTSYYTSRFETLRSRMDHLRAKIQKQISALLRESPDLKVIEYHKEFTYFLEEFGIPSQGAIEDKPGVKPSAGRLARVAIEAKRQRVRVALAAKHSPRDLLKKFTEISSVPHRTLPLSVSGQRFGDYEKLMNRVVSALAQK